MWYYNGKPLEEIPEGYVGFVYVITDKSNDKMYVGKKGFWSRKTLPPLKGKTRKRRSLVESDWMNYYGSSDEVKKLVEEQGNEMFHREIIHLCKSKSEMSYLEAKEQFDREVLLDDRYYNGIINCKIHRKHVQSLK